MYFNYLLKTVIFTILCVNNPTNGLTWGGWNGDRTANVNYELVGTEYDEIRNILTSLGADVSPELTSELTSSYLSTINVFFTSEVAPRSVLTSNEQEALVEWVKLKGGILLIAGCHLSYYDACRSFVEPFGLSIDTVGSSVDWTVYSSCSGEHPILNGVQEVYHLKPELFLIGETEATVLCFESGVGITDVILQTGSGYVLFSSMNMYRDFYYDEKDNTKYFENIVLWTEQLRCDDICRSEGLPGQCDDNVCDDDNVCTIDFCDPSTGCKISDDAMVDIDFKTDQNQIDKLTPKIIHSSTWHNPTTETNSETDQWTESSTISSSFEQTTGVSVTEGITVTTSASGDIDALFGASIGLDYGYSTTLENSWTYTKGESTTEERKNSHEYNIPPFSSLKVEVLSIKAKIYIPYTGTVHYHSGCTSEVTGTWTGVAESFDTSISASTHINCYDEGCDGDPYCDWYDSRYDSCTQYEVNNWCDDPLADSRSYDGVNALDACCICGGGHRVLEKRVVAPVGAVIAVSVGIVFFLVVRTMKRNEYKKVTHIGQDRMDF